MRDDRHHIPSRYAHAAHDEKYHTPRALAGTPPLQCEVHCAKHSTIVPAPAMMCGWSNPLMYVRPCSAAMALAMSRASPMWAP
jgi:hypothetical protein